MTVLIYFNTSEQVADHNHLKVFANADAAEARFAENDPEGVGCAFEIMGPPIGTNTGQESQVCVPGMSLPKSPLTGRRRPQPLLPWLGPFLD